MRNENEIKICIFFYSTMKPSFFLPDQMIQLMFCIIIMNMSHASDSDHQANDIAFASCVRFLLADNLLA